MFERHEMNSGLDPEDFAALFYLNMVACLENTSSFSFPRSETKSITKWANQTKTQIREQDDSQIKQIKVQKEHQKTKTRKQKKNKSIKNKKESFLILTNKRVLDHNLKINTLSDREGYINMMYCVLFYVNINYISNKNLYHINNWVIL